MTRSSKIYAAFLSVFGIAVGVGCTFVYFQTAFTGSHCSEELQEFFVLMLLYVVCRCFPIFIRDDFAFDMSFICALAAVLSKGPEAAAALALLSTPFVVKRSARNSKNLSHIFNTPLIKTAFNASNFILSIYASGSIYRRLGGPITTLSVQRFILPGSVMVLSVIFINSSILLALFALNGQVRFFPALGKNMVEFLPNVLASAPIGYFLANFMSMDGGEYIALLFMLPLLLARYSFVLYLNVKNNYYNMIQTLTAALEAKDRYTVGHSHMVETYSEKIARQMKLSNSRVEEIKVGALLHDIGKIGIDDSILNKPARLTPDERLAILRHPEIGNDILKNVELSETSHMIILHHHERYDGGGYPGHTAGDELPIDVYIVSAADAFDAMTSERPYCKNRTKEQAIEILREESGKQFHPKVVEAFIEVLNAESSAGQKQ